MKSAASFLSRLGFSTSPQIGFGMRCSIKMLMMGILLCSCDQKPDKSNCGTQSFNGDVIPKDNETDMMTDTGRVATTDTATAATTDRDTVATTDSGTVATTDRDTVATTDRDTVATTDRDTVATTDRDTVATTDSDSLVQKDSDTLVAIEPVPIVSFYSGKCLDIVGDNTEEKNLEITEIDQWTCFGYQSQQWIFDDAGEGFYTIRSLFNEKCLGVNDADHMAVLDKCSNSDAQKWLLEVLEDKVYAIVNGKFGSDNDTKRCLDVVNESVADGERIQLRDCHFGYNQRWTFETTYKVNEFCPARQPTVESCDGIDNDCDGDIDEGCKCIDADVRPCGTHLGECTEGTETCVNGNWGDCVGDIEPETEICDGRDNDCDGDIDEGCDCINDEVRPCGTNLGECTEGTQNCENGAWQICVGDIKPMTETCDGIDNDCDGDIDEGCECSNLTVRRCSAGLGACASGQQTCENEFWGPCLSLQSAKAELCDGIDNDCDGVIDNGFNLDTPCDATGKCPQRRVCSDDGMSSVCLNDEQLWGEERCDGIDNDCDGLVDLVSEFGSLRSVCTCQRRVLSIGKAVDASMEGNPNFCAATACGGLVLRLKVDGICYPVCQIAGSDPNGDGWGWENAASCIVEDSSVGRSATSCDEGAASDDFMSISYCLDCIGNGEMPYAMCQTEMQYDLSAFGRGDEWLRVDYTYSALGPAQNPVNLWFNAAERKRLPLVRIGEVPGRYQKLLRIDDACYIPSPLFGDTCVGNGQACSHCNYDEVCGAVVECGKYDLSQAWLQVAAEFCEQGSGEMSGTVTLHNVQLVEPNCVD